MAIHIRKETDSRKKAIAFSSKMKNKNEEARL